MTEKSARWNARAVERGVRRSAEGAAENVQVPGEPSLPGSRAARLSLRRRATVCKVAREHRVSTAASHLRQDHLRASNFPASMVPGSGRSSRRSATHVLTHSTRGDAHSG